MMNPRVLKRVFLALLVACVVLALLWVAHTLRVVNLDPLDKAFEPLLALLGGLGAAIGYFASDREERARENFVDEFLDLAETFTSKQVRLFFQLVKLQRDRELFQIPAPDGGRRNEFHNDLRALREAVLVHALEDGKPKGRFSGGRLVQVFPWALRLLRLIPPGLKTADGKSWPEIEAEVNKPDKETIRKELNERARGS